LKERLISEQQRYTTLEKLTKEATANKTEQQQQQRNKSGYTAGDQRPAALVRKYGELYSQTRYNLDCQINLSFSSNCERITDQMLQQGL